MNAQSWKAQADAEIAELRMAPLTVTVSTSDGAAVANASVHVRMRESAFRWGSVVRISDVNQFIRSGFPIGSNHPYYNHLLNFNSITPGNAGKWKFWLRPDSRATYLDVMDWLNENEVANRGHTNVWPSIFQWNAVPDTVLNAQAIFDENGNEVLSKNDHIRSIVRAHFEEYMPIMQSKGVYEMDVVNELVHVPDITRSLMGLDRDARVREHTQWYEWAREAAPDVDLVANEFDLYQSGGNFHLDFVDYVRQMMALGAPIDRIGMQGHFFSNVPVFAELTRRLDQVAVLGLPMAVTEYDMVGTRAEEIERALYAVFRHPSCYGFTLWGAWDGAQWRGNGAVYEEDWSLKPSGRRYFELVKEQWATDTVVATSAQGDLEIDVFHGLYDVYVEVDGQLTPAEVTVSEEGAAVNMVLGTEAFATPDAALSIVGEPDVVFPNQPVTFTVTADQEVARVIFYDDFDIIANQTEGPFELTYTRGETNRVVRPRAEVIFANSYRLDLTAPSYTTSDANQPPAIQEVFPANNSQVLVRDGLSLRVRATDDPGDLLTATLLDADGNEIGTSTSRPFIFVIDGIAAGPNRYTLRVSDDRFGVTEQIIQLNGVGMGSSTAQLSPLEADDDIEQRSDGSIDHEGDLDMGEKLCAVRFSNAGIPRGARINSAFVQFSSEKPNQAGDVQLTLRLENEGTPSRLDRRDNNVAQRRPTRGSVIWEGIPTWTNVGDRGPAQRTPDIGILVQEVVTHPAWSISSPIHLLVSTSPTGSKRSAFAIDQSVVERAVLTVEFTSEIEVPALAAPGEPAGAGPGGTEFIVWDDENDPELVAGYELLIDDELYPNIVRETQINVPEDWMPGELHTVCVRALGQFGQPSPYSECALLGTVSVLNPAELGVAIYPNPVAELLRISSQNGLLTRVELLDAKGRLVRSQTNRAHEYSIDVADLPSGSYSVRVIDAEGRVGVQQVVVR